MRDIDEKFRARIAKARVVPPDEGFEDRLAEYLRKGEGAAWMRLRLEQERIEAEREDDTPPILKGWRKL